MRRRDEWRKVLDSEMERWTAMSCEQLLAELRDPPLVYEVEFDSKVHQVEVELLENTEEYLHVMVGIDDGSLPASMFPVSQSFICRKAPARR
jgi:hypothetical protein